MDITNGQSFFFEFYIFILYLTYSYGNINTSNITACQPNIPQTTVFIKFYIAQEESNSLKLEDDTKKIFLNMDSRNGSQEFVSLLQYMKDTRIDNPNIVVKDSRILELNDIVTEVKESEEWEAVQMNFMEVCIEKGRAQGIKAMIELCCELDMSHEETIQKLMQKFLMSNAEAKEYVEKYWP